jgi:fructose-1,6-bisphosphatase/inositol monophosphatase family enzyme
MENLNEYLEFAKDIAKHAGKVMLKYFNLEGVSEYKGDRTIVTLADTEINGYLIERVKKEYPSHGVDGEEEGYNKKSKSLWVCDPVDGTAMFARGIPVAVFSLAFVLDGEPLVGVILDPFTSSLYTAAKGQGAFKNGKKITVNDYNLDDKRSVGDYCMWALTGYDVHKTVIKLRERTYMVSLGSVTRACVLVADGQFTFELFPGTKTKNVDVAAAKVIVEEAGGIVRDFNGNEQRYDQDLNGVIISNKACYNDVLNTLKTTLGKKLL